MRFWKQWIDRRAIELAARSVPQARGVAVDAAEIWARLRDPVFLKPPEMAPTFEPDAGGFFTFRSFAPVRFERSNTVHGRFFPGEGDWTTRPCVVIVHGWNAELHYLYGCPRLARGLNERGVNAILVELPFHLQRRPQNRAEMTDFISDDLAGMLDATRQALADIEALLRWARARGCPRAGVLGFSLGAWLAGLHATESSTAHALAMVTPVPDLESAVRTLAFCHPIRAALERAPVSLAPLNLTSRRPRIDPSLIATVESEYDLFAPQSSCDALARAWQLRERICVREGHLSVLISRGAMGKTLDWLAAALAKN